MNAVLLLLLHGLAGVALLGVLTHQAVASRAAPTPVANGFLGRYAGVAAAVFVRPVLMLFPLVTLLGALLYPAYRLDVRVPLEEMRLGWAIGLFELKEHTVALGLFLLPLYAAAWSGDAAGPATGLRAATTRLLAGIAWFAFLVGHLVNNLRGLG